MADVYVDWEQTSSRTGWLVFPAMRRSSSQIYRPKFASHFYIDNQGSQKYKEEGNTRMWDECTTATAKNDVIVDYSNIPPSVGRLTASTTLSFFLFELIELQQFHRKSLNPLSID